RDARHAAAALADAPSSPDVEVDRAVAALQLGQRDEALARLDAVLRDAPRHAQARWDRALVLRDLGLPLAAAAEFDAVAALGEPGWSDEARARAADLRRGEARAEEAWQKARANAIAWATSDAPLAAEVLRAW